MKAKKTAKIICGILVLAGFSIYLYATVSTSPKSSDYGSTYEREIVYVTPAPQDGTGAEAVTVSAAPAATPAPTATPEPTVDPNSPAGRAAARGLPAPPDVDVTSWEFMLANGDNSISDYEPESMTSLGGQRVDSRIVEALKAMVADSEAQGLSVYLSSGYRSYSEQAANFTRICQNNGVSDGKDAQGYYITMPAGCSEHQTGLCMDITDKYYERKTSEMLEKTALYQYMSKHCHEFGFIVRFPDGRQPVTGVMYEPWHYRYVGVEAATYIMENNLCFEEFLSLYPEADGYVYHLDS